MRIPTGGKVPLYQDATGASHQGKVAKSATVG